MARNYLIFVFGVFILLVFSFAFAYTGVYAQNLISGILAIVGFVTSLVLSIFIGIASRDEGGNLFVWFFAIAGVTAVLLIWYLTRAGTLLQIW
jgi:hypothetical protein